MLGPTRSALQGPKISRLGSRNSRLGSTNTRLDPGNITPSLLAIWLLSEVVTNSQIELFPCFFRKDFDLGLEIPMIMCCHFLLPNFNLFVYF